MSVAGEVVFHEIPFLPHFPESSGRSVSHDGRYVAGHSLPYSFRWDSHTGEMIQLEQLPETDWVRYGWISADGSVVAASSIWGSSTNRSTRWMADDWQPEYLGPNLAEQNGVELVTIDMPLGMSGNGQVVVGQSATEFIFTEYHGVASYQPYRWTEKNGMEYLAAPEALNATFGAAYGASYDGSVIVGWFRPAGSGSSRAFRWVEGVTNGLQQIGPASGNSFATNVTTDGSLIVGYGGLNSFRWTEQTGFVNLGHYVHNGQALTTRALAVSDNGIAVGYAMLFNNGWQHFAVIHDDVNGWRNLQTVLEDDYDIDLFGWTLREALDVSPNGRFIVGEAVNPFGQTQGFYVALPEAPTVPCPGDLTGSGNVGVPDLLQLLAAWGPCPAPPAACPADLTGNGNVGVPDLLQLLAAWGPCP